MTDGGDMAVEVREPEVVGFFLRTLCPYSFADIFVLFRSVVLVVLVAAGVYGVVIFIEEVIYLQFRRLLSD
jgi:hypothetical protein